MKTLESLEEFDAYGCREAKENTGLVWAKLQILIVSSFSKLEELPTIKIRSCAHCTNPIFASVSHINMLQTPPCFHTGQLF